MMLVIAKTNAATCQHCRKTITQPHSHDDPITLRHLPILEHPVYIRIRPKRFRCPDSDGRPTTMQRLDWYEPRALHTIPDERHLLMLYSQIRAADVITRRVDRWQRDILHDAGPDWHRTDP